MTNKHETVSQYDWTTDGNRTYRVTVLDNRQVNYYEKMTDEFGTDYWSRLAVERLELSVVSRELARVGDLLQKTTVTHWMSAPKLTVKWGLIDRIDEATRADKVLNVDGYLVRVTSYYITDDGGIDITMRRV